MGQAQSFTLPRMFSDHMVLQQQTRIPVWGNAPEGEAVTVAFQGQRHTAAAVNGSWKIELEPAEAGGPFDMIVMSREDEIVIRDILVGEVWIAGGQSNMGYSFKEFHGEEQGWMREAFNGDFSGFRLFQAAEHAVNDPADDVLHGEWIEVSRENLMRLAALPVFYGYALGRRLNVPVGIVQVSRSGTKASCWIPRRIARSDSSFSYILDEIEQDRKQSGTENPVRPFALYNGMVSPVQPYAMRGVIWYQGESDALENKAQHYAKLFPALIEAWRRDWGGREFPFLFVQLPDYSKGTDSWKAVQEAQRRTLQQVPNTGMVVTIDLGETDDLHPRNKQPIGERLADLAANQVYGEEDGDTGPLLKK